MSDVIKLLPDSVANQIAAGEVIQRPASVIKELVENAIDAQATHVQIILKDAGRTLIQIIDDGVGMSETDARLAFERHSTSKIRCADDLFTLHTMGFRGEALASIAAISQVELRTRRHDAQLGTRLVINASQCESQEPDMCPVGSNFMVKNIFFNVPARRKFLKSNQVELSNIVKEFEKLALVNHEVEFTLIHNDNVMYKLMQGTFRQRIAALMGNNIDQQLLPVTIDTSMVKVQGYIGKPENARKRNALQFMFVNGRYMRHPYFHKAVMSAYEQLIPEGEQPNYFLRFTVEPEAIDVNIHPTKTEIKFEDEMPIWQILAAGVKETLGRFSEVPAIDFDTKDAPAIPAYSGHVEVHHPEIAVDPSYNPFKSQNKPGGGAAHHHVPDNRPMSNWDELFANFERKKREGLEQQGANSMAEDTSDAQQTVLPVDDVQSVYLQLKGRYILSPAKSGLMVIDQHRAHVRILFDRYIGQLHTGNLSSQAILFPEVLHLSAAQSVALQELLPEMEQMGFQLDSMGGNDWAINAIPAGIEGVDPVAMVQQILESVDNGGMPVKRRIMEHLSLTVARSAAIPVGRTLQQEEMEVLVADLLRLPEPNYTPDGKTIITVIPMEQITKLF
ncbi:MAG: DNA mismatch repair endonuclease MutL [Muribaculaceae bacterium]|jgi:DNA mismatch repair protein MutL|nr:DNA mismatch repair endonuclease MutL [Muribaculaceae bacterium]